MDIKVIGINLAKNVFQVCVYLIDNSIMSNKKVNRNKLLNKIRQLPKVALLLLRPVGQRITGEDNFKQLVIKCNWSLLNTEESPDDFQINH